MSNLAFCSLFLVLSTFFVSSYTTESESNHSSNATLNNGGGGLMCRSCHIFSASVAKRYTLPFSLLGHPRRHNGQGFPELTTKVESVLWKQGTTLSNSATLPMQWTPQTCRSQETSKPLPWATLYVHQLYIHCRVCWRYFPGLCLLRVRKKICFAHHSYIQGG